MDAVRSRGAILQADRALPAQPAEPLVAGPNTATSCLGRGRHRPSEHHDSLTQQPSTGRGQAGVTVQTHWVSLVSSSATRVSRRPIYASGTVNNVVRNHS